MASCHLAAVQYHRYLVAHMHIGGTRHNLNGFRSDIYLTDNQFIRIRVLFYGQDLSHHNFLEILVKLFVSFHLGSG